MPEYRRPRITGGTTFFTVVTFDRLPIFSHVNTRKLLRLVWKDVSERMPFTTDAVCLLPDHIHCIWTMPEDDSNYSVRWKEIKRLFTRAYLSEIGPGRKRGVSRRKRSEAAIWQRRFWEHMVRDEADLNRHIDYIHYNPVKHDLAQRVSDWPWFSFHRYVRSGFYGHHWGETFENDVKGMGYGE